MKVGDLIRVNTAGNGILRSRIKNISSQLGVIVGKDAGQWIVILMSGRKFWFDPKEIEVVNESG